MWVRGRWFKGKNVNYCISSVSGWLCLFCSHIRVGVGIQVSRKFLTSSLRHPGTARLVVGTSGISFRAMEARPRFYYDIQSFPTSTSSSCIIIISWLTFFKVIHSFSYIPSQYLSLCTSFIPCPSSLSTHWLLLIIVVNRFLENYMCIFKKITAD